MIKIISVREHHQFVKVATHYIQSKWACNDDGMKKVYEDCIKHSVNAELPLPQWYLLYDEDKIIGCAGLITNDFISRMDLYPWISTIFIEEEYRGHSYASLLIDKAKSDAKEALFKKVYLETDHIGYYERYGFEYIAVGYSPSGESSRIYMSKV